MNDSPATSKTIKLYYHPHYKRATAGNPYLDRLMEGLSRDFDVINRNAPTGLGIFDIFRNLHRTHILFCNWIEDTPDMRFGYIQSLALVLFLYAKRLVGVKVVWVLHNKVSHAASHRALKLLLVKTLLKQSDLVLTHSREGIDFARGIEPASTGKIRFFHHPVPEFTAQIDRTERKYDILIWGAVHPYKGVLEFLQTLNSKNALQRYRILIWGKFSSDEYYRECLSFASPTIEIRNEFISDQQLKELERASGVVLFTYRTRSVLSSAALMDSLDSNAMIVGPDTGAFRDLADEDCIDVYRDLDDVIPTIDRVLQSPSTAAELVARRAAFFKQNTWELTTKRINATILDELDRNKPTGRSRGSAQIRPSS